MEEVTEECSECKGTGKCRCCDGLGRVAHVCSLGSLELIAENSFPWARDRITYRRCKVCGRYWKNIYQPDPAAGSSSEWLKLGEKSKSNSFTQSELDKVLEDN